MCGRPRSVAGDRVGRPHRWGVGLGFRLGRRQRPGRAGSGADAGGGDAGAAEEGAGDVSPEDARFVTSSLDTSLPFVGRRGRATQSSVGGGVWPVAGLAALAGVGFVAAAGSLWADRRRRELRLLSVRGVSPAGLGFKAVLELVLPLAVGAAGGGALAYGLVM